MSERGQSGERGRDRDREEELEGHMIVSLLWMLCSLALNTSGMSPCLTLHDMIGSHATSGHGPTSHGPGLSHGSRCLCPHHFRYLHRGG